MSRTNKSKNGHGSKKWYKREGNSTGRTKVRQRLKGARESMSESLYNEILADKLEERGRLDMAEKIRNRDTPDLPVKLTELWDRWSYD